MYNNGIVTFTANGTLTEKMRVKITAASATTPAQVEAAGAGEQHIGITETAAADTTLVAVRMRAAGGTQEAMAAGAFAVGATLYGAAAGKVDDASSGTAIGIAKQAATADGDIVEIVEQTVISTTAATVSIADAGSFTTAAEVESAIQEIYQHMLTAQAFIPIALHSVRETTNFDVANVAANGGLLASDTTPVLEAINAATDGCQRLSWAATNVDQVTFQTPLPPDIDVTADVVVHIRAAMEAVADTPDITVDSFFNEGDTKVVDTISAITGTAYAEYTGTIGNADVPAGAQTLTVGLTPAAHGTDDLYITAIWIEYTKKTLTS